MKNELVAAALALAVLSAATPALATHDTAPGMERAEVSNALGTMTYAVYAPPGLTGPAPLMVHVHGGNNDADASAHRSRLNELAAERGFVVAYPQEDPAHGGGIFDHEVAAAEGRDGRIASLIALVTREVMASYPIDPRRVYVGGISAGSGVAIVMAAQYPDLYAGVHAEGGDRYGPASVDEFQAGRNVFAAMGPRARRIPFIVSIGTIDPFGITTNTDSVVRHWLLAHDLTDDGLENGSVPSTPAATRSGFDGKNYTVDTYVDADGCVLAEKWLIQGMFHSYAGGEQEVIGDPQADPMAPHMRRIAHEFLEDQYDAGGPPGCRAPRAAEPEVAAAGSPTPLALALLALAALVARRRR